MLAAFLAITVGVGMAGVTPAMAAPASGSAVTGLKTTQVGLQDTASTDQEGSEQDNDQSSTNVVTPAAVGDGMYLTKTLSSANEIRPGDRVSYQITLGCSSITNPCTNATLLDLLPEPLVLQGIDYVGFDEVVTEEWAEDGSQVLLTFNETAEDRPGQVGINDGAEYTINITAKMPDDADPKYNGQQLINKAVLTSDTGQIEDEAPAVVPTIDLAPNAQISKEWSVDKVEQHSGAEATATLGGIKNTSKVGAKSLTIQEPSGASDPFSYVAFTGFGEIVYPEGADQLTVTYYVAPDNEPTTLDTAAPNAPPAFPSDLDLSTITGFEFVFTSSDSTETEGGIVVNGSAGSISLNTVVRDGAEAVVVTNETSIVAELPNGEKNDPFTAEDSFVIESASYAVDATKSFSPERVVAGDAAEIGDGKNASTVKLGLTNTSNRNLTNLTLTEPAEGTSPFGEGIDFEKFVGGTWPEDASSGVLTVNGSDYTLSNVNGSISLPEGLPSGIDVSGFVISFDGTFAPGAGFNFEFDVLATEVSGDEGFKNVVLGQGTPSGNPNVVEDEAEATLIAEEPTYALIGGKGFTPHRIEGIVGDKTTVWLNTKVDGDKTNMDVREIIQTDIFENMVDGGFKATSVSVQETRGASKVLVEVTKDGGETWALIAVSEGEAIGDTALEADVNGVRITYTREEGTFPEWQDVRAELEFEVTEVLNHGLETDNVLGVNNGDDVTGSVWVDKDLQLESSKWWNSNVIVQKPSDMNPSSTLGLWAKNTSTYSVDKLSIVDPQEGTTNPFSYVDITGVTAQISNEALADLAVLVLKTAEGDITLEGTDALNASLPDGRSWNEVIGFEFTLAKIDEQSIPRDTEIWLTVGTELRDTLRGTEQPVDKALAELDPERSIRGYTLPNTAVSTIEREGDPTATKEPEANLEIITENSVDLNPVLTKTFNPEGPLDFFASGGNPAPVKVTLNVNSGTHKADFVQIADVDPTFWNSVNFLGWNPQPGGNGGNVTIEYFTGATFSSVDGQLTVDGGDWTTSVPANEDVQGIRYTTTTDNYDELSNLDTRIEFNVLPRYTLRSGELISIDGATINPGEQEASMVENTATAEVSRLGKDHETNNADADLVFNEGTTGANVDKWSDAANGKIAPGRAFNYTFTVTNNGTDAILNPVITDKLPSDDQGPLLVLEPDWATSVSYAFDKKFNQAPDGTSIDTSTVQAAQNESLLEFTFPEGTKLYPGESFTVTLPTAVRGGVTANEDLTNEVTFTGDNLEEVKDSETVGIIEGQAYSSRKLVREVFTGEQTEPTGIYNVNSKIENDEACYEFDGGFYRYPCIVQTKPGGTAEWQVSVTNTGNVNAQHVEILDVFPYVGDTGVTGSQAGTPRGTEWVPTLQDVKLPVVPEGTEMVLSYLTGDPASCKPTGGNAQDPWAGCEDNWTTERPVNPKEIKGLKLVLDFPEGLAPGQSIGLTFTTISATEMPDGASEFAPAWNSFGYSAEAEVNGSTDYRSQEPIKTGITFTPEEKEKVSVGDYVWVDENRDGLQDDGEPGIKDVLLVLTGPDGEEVLDVYGNPVEPTWTDENGYYTFENLPVLDEGQSYTVSIDREKSKDALAPYVPTKETEGNREEDSSTWEATSEGLTKDGEHDPTLDFGFVLKTYAVGDYVWVDENKDGIQGDDEVLEGVKVFLLDGEGTQIAETTTDENGRYIFDELPAGEYQIKFELTEAQAVKYKFTSQDSGEGDEQDARDSDADPETGLTIKFTLDDSNTALTKDYTDQEVRASEGIDPTWDAGVVLKTYAVGDYVWVDENKDGIQGDDEVLEGVKVFLLDGEGTQIAETTTDENGRYIFDELPAGEYQIKFELTEAQAVKYKFTSQDSGEGDEQDARDSDADPETGLTIKFTLDDSNTALTKDYTDQEVRASEGIDPTWDAGVVLKPQVSLGDYVWFDENKDGLQGEDENGIKGVVLKLTGPDGEDVVDINGEPVGPVTTDENGYYIFKDLPVLEEGQSYKVTIDQDASREALEGYVPTKETEGNREEDSSTWEATSEGLTTDGEHDPTLDFGFIIPDVPKVSLGDYVWFDEDKDGLQGEDENGIKGVVLKLTGPDGEDVVDINGEPVGPVTTDENGYYIFKDLPVLEEGQSYKVTIDQEASREALEGYVPTKETEGNREEDSSTWEATSEGLTTDGEHDPTLDFGFIIPDPDPEPTEPSV
ncbi:SdrD B-like domain-containing protein, partial [Glutamicibacter sp. MNS18]|uniref:SdrD B-like domain-containing protein n=1 Tax=Glutamicibacter sp. MNS18 TaxID=2989817 RepID=UPI002236B5B3